ncbi:DNA helicase, transcriptional elongation [Alphaentomopoxvirus acuprea]|uniref:DNA helicase, transcriptional elongation n=1 Tax=Alphaentomopoxvirus acuprea TaxID=62099 RepID=W6JIU7_9POXV|nr:DNA helicase, transcriptional elongation [Anomala cuprea entomopoxvirus]BAO49508.1 DNA helicase, transcriptional elongation [Anomala cuprea entomopoxvirus]
MNLIYKHMNDKLYGLFYEKLKTQHILCYDSDNNPYFLNKENKNILKNIIIPPSIISDLNLQIHNLNNDTINKNIQSNIILRDEQRIIVTKIEELYSNFIPVYVLLECPCGYGKTIISIELICRLKLKCAIVVPRKFIIQQWKDKFNTNTFNIFTSFNGRVDAIKNITNGLDCDIFICPDKHLENDTIRNFIYTYFNFIIIDEIHKYDLNKDIAMTKFLYGKYFKLVLLLTATPKNNINLIINNKIKINKIDTQIKKEIYSFELPMKINDSNITSECKKFLSKINLNKYNNLYTKNYIFKYCISLDKMRNNTITQIIKQNINDTTKAILLTDYRNHMHELYTLLKSELTDIIYIYDVKDNKYNLFSELECKNKFIIISTIAACSESLDLTNLNTIYLVLPITNKNSLIQCTGRIMRTSNENKYIYLFNFSYLNDIIRTFINDKCNFVKRILNNWEYNIYNDIYIT